MDIFLGHYNYWVAVVLMLLGFYAVIARGNLVKKMIGLAIFQVSVLLFYISLGSITGGMPPILVADVANYVNPVPHVLMLTAIVVGVSVFAVGMALIVRIKASYGSIDEDDILKIDRKANIKEREGDAKL